MLMTEPLFRLTDVRRDFAVRSDSLWARSHRVHAVRPTDLTVWPGRSLGVIGESGSGKSTLVRLLAALDSPSSGSLHYRGRPLPRGRAARSFRRDTGIVFQDPHSSLDPRMTVGQIVAEPLRGLGIRGDRRSRVAEVLDDVGLASPIAARYPHELSGGQRQRVALARAVSHRPRILIADEPVSALDVTVRAQILDLLQGLKRTLDLTLILVSHDIAIVRDLCDDVAVMQSGRILEHGDAARLLTRPQHPYTRSLLESIPSLDGPHRR